MKRVLMSMLTLVVSIVVFLTNVDAANHFSVNLTTNLNNDQQVVLDGQSVIITLKFDEYQGVTKGINAYKAMIEYDSAIFEEVVEKDFMALNGWTGLKYNQKTKEFVSIRKSGSKNSEDVLQITLKIKENIGSIDGRTIIKVKDIVVSDGTQDLQAADKSVIISIPKIEDNTSGSGIKPSTSSGSNTQSSSKSNVSIHPSSKSTTSNSEKNSKATSSQDSNSTMVDSDELLTDIVDAQLDGNSDELEFYEEDEQEITEADEKIEQELSKYKRRYIGYCFLFTLTFIVFVLIIWYYKHREDEDDENPKSKKSKIIVLVFLMAALSLQILGITSEMVSALVVQGDVTGDGITDYSDVDLLEAHLIHLQNIQNRHLENADMNVDNKISITDLALLVQKIEKTLNYTVNMSGIAFSKTQTSKNEEITLSFSADVNYESTITQIIVNDKLYKTELVDGKDNQYIAKINTGDVAGNIDFSIDAVILENGQKVIIDYKKQIKILSDKPTVSDVIQEDDIDSSRVILNFDVQDIDDTFMDGKLILTMQDGGSIQEKSIKVGKNRLTFTVEEGKKYTYTIQLTYNRDFNKNDSTNMVENDVLKTGIVQLIGNYQLDVSNIITYNDAGVTEYFEKNDDIYVKFNSTNVSEFVPEKVVINGESHNLVQNGNVYHTKVKADKASKQQKVSIEKVVLNNGKTFNIHDEQAVVDILKDRPIVSNLVQKDNADQLQTNLQFTVKDTDHAFISGKVVLKQEDEVIEEKIVKVGKNNVQFSVDNDKNYDYFIQMTYDKDTNKMDNINLVRNEVVQTGIVHLISDYELDVRDVETYKKSGITKYFEKNEDIYVRFKSSNISEFIPKQVIIDEERYDLVRSGDVYHTKVKAKKSSGEQNISFKKIVLSNGKILKLNDDSVVVDILKDKPIITDFIQRDDTDNLQTNLQFSINDPDASFISGKVILKSEDGTVQEKKIKVGRNNILFTVDNDKNYTYSLQMAYDRDTNTKDHINLVGDEVVQTGDVHLIKSYKVTVDNVTTSKGNKETKSFMKGDKIAIKFNSSTNSQSVLVKAIINGKEYKLTNSGSTYQTEMIANKEAGEQNITVEKVILDDGQVIEVLDNNQLVIDILKDKPVIADFVQKDDIEHLQTNLKFNIKDTDDTLTSGKVILKSENGDIQEKEIQVGDNDISFAVENDKDYTYLLQMTYNQNNDKASNTNVVKDEVMKTGSIHLVGNSKLELTDIETYKKSGVTKYFEKNEDIYIKFKSTSANDTILERAIINDESYELVRNGNVYHTKIKAKKEAGEQQLLIEKVILNDGKTFDIHNGKVVVNILRDKPIMDSFVQDDDADSLQTKLKFNIKDIDNSFVDGKLVLKSEDDIISEKEVQIGVNDIVFAVENNKNYTYSLQMTYDRDNDKKDQINLVEDEVLQTGSVYLLGDYGLEINKLESYKKSGVTKYFEKNEDIYIKFESTNASAFVPEKVVINGQKYNLVRNGYVYHTKIKAKKSSGEQHIAIEKVILNNGKTIELSDNNEIVVDILKNKPVLADFVQEDNASSLQAKLKFNIEDADSTFISGKAVLTSEDGNILEKEIQVGENDIVFAVENNKKYTYSVQVTYDKDSNPLDGIHLVEDEVMETGSIHLIRDYEVEISNMKSYKSMDEEKYFAKGEKVTIKFDSTNNSNLVLAKAIINGKTYKLTSSENTYQTEIDAFKQAGQQTITVEKVIFKDGKTIEIFDNNTTVVDILKDSPVVEKFVQEDKDDKLQTNLKFSIKDTDHAFISGKIILRAEDGNIQEKEVQVGDNHIFFDVDNNKDYIYLLQVTYDKDSDKIDHINLIEDEELYKGSVHLIKDYELKVDNIMVNKGSSKSKYLVKGEKVTVKFNSSNNSRETPIKAVINGKSYKLVNSDNMYQAEIEVGKKSGKQEIVIEKITLSNQKELEVLDNNKIVVDILKDKPVVFDFVQEEDANKLQVNLKFNIKDMDGSFISGKVILKSEDGDISEQEIHIGDNNIPFTVKNDKDYTYSVQMTYDRDDDTDASNLVENETVQIGSINLSGDYELEVSDIQTYNGTNLTKYFSKGEKITIKFNSSNNSQSVPVKAIINGKEYKLVSSDNMYQTEITANKEAGEQKITIEKIILSNQKELEVLNNNKIVVDILKDKPVVTSFVQEDNAEDLKVNLIFNVKDIDQSFVNGKVILEHENGKVYEKEIQAGDNHISFTVENAQKYNYSIQMTYDRDSNSLDDTNLVENKVVKTGSIHLIGDYELEVSNVITMNQNLEESKYFTKGEKFILKFTSTNASCFVPKKAVINGQEYELINSSDTYEAEMDANDHSGEQEIVIEKIILNNGKTFDLVTDNQVKIDVLKDKPAIEELNQKESLKDSKLIFDLSIKDLDDSYIEGKVILTKQEDGSVSEKKIQVGDNHIDFSVEEGKNYVYSVQMTYDRDSNSTDNINLVENEVIKEKPFQLIEDYDFKIDNLITNNESGESKYFRKGEDIIVKFTSTNTSQFTPFMAVINGKSYILTDFSGVYEANIGSHKESGIQNIRIEKIVLMNGKTFEVIDNNRLKIEVLKDDPEAIKVGYMENDQEFTTVFDFNDFDHSLVRGTIIAEDENGVEIKTQPLIRGRNKFTFDKNIGELYFVKVVASYDLDNNRLDSSTNDFKNQVLLQEQMNVMEQFLDMKDIVGITLYHKNGDELKKIVHIKPSEISDLSQYVVEVETSSIPSFYTTIQEVKEENSTLKFVLDYDGLVLDQGMKKNMSLEVEFGKIENGIAENLDFETLIHQIKENPSGNYMVYRDFDATDIINDGILISDEFSGIIDFNGHQIKNLSVPLFDKLENARIENLVIKDSNVTANGIVANHVVGTTIRNVYIKNSSITSSNDDATGILVGNASGNTLIEVCSITEVRSKGNKKIAGFIGKIVDTTIRNSYLQGEVSSSGDYSGGFVGEALKNCVIENSYANVVTTFMKSSNTNAGFVGNSQNVILRNNLSIATTDKGGYGFHMFGNDIHYLSRNNYELVDSAMISNVSHVAVNPVTLTDLAMKDFYTKRLGWDEKIWNLDSVFLNHYPSLQ